MAANVLFSLIAGALEEGGKIQQVFRHGEELESLLR